MVNLVCPRCDYQNLYPMVFPQTIYNFTCPNCQLLFTSWFCNIRSKNSRGNKRDNQRQFSVRVYDLSGSEQLIEFSGFGYNDFELRSRDLAVFTSINNELMLVQNLTVNRYIKKRPPPCYIATYLYGPESEEVFLLRHFRNETLMPSKILSKGVLLYYVVSPKLVHYFGDSKLFKILCLLLIAPLVKQIKKLVKK